MLQERDCGGAAIAMNWWRIRQVWLECTLFMQKASRWVKSSCSRRHSIFALNTSVGRTKWDENPRKKLYSAVAPVAKKSWLDLCFRVGMQCLITALSITLRMNHKQPTKSQRFLWVGGIPSRIPRGWTAWPHLDWIVMTVGPRARRFAQIRIHRPVKISWQPLPTLLPSCLISPCVLLFAYLFVKQI